MSIYFSVGWILNMEAMLTSWQKQDPFKEHANEMLIKAVCIPVDVSCVLLATGRSGSLSPVSSVKLVSGFRRSLTL
jgi:hypothetical protein